MGVKAIPYIRPWNLCWPDFQAGKESHVFINPFQNDKRSE